jgi:uncharacterized protein YraI
MKLPAGLIHQRLSHDFPTMCLHDCRILADVAILRIGNRELYKMRKIAFGFLLLIMLLSLVQTALGQSGVRAVVVNENANIRIIPAIGAEVITTVQAGYVFEHINARSPDNQWLRVDFNGSEGWVNVTPLAILSGDVASLPVADPRTIPYGGFDAPRAGVSNATSEIMGRLPFSGVRVRSGPSTAYPVLANAPRYTVMPLLGRTASNQWVQVNFETTLGWVTAGVLEFQNGRSIVELPIDGIVADALPVAEPIHNDYVDTLKLMLARLDLAQPSLDAVRIRWSDAALAGRVFCSTYPARPSNYNIPQQLLAAFYDPLFELSNLFNDAMFNVRHAIDLLIQACEQPGLQNPVGQATVIGALETIALADQQFLRLREWLLILIPPDLQPGEGQCLFTYGNKSEILDVIRFGVIITDEITPRDRATGYCIDLIAGQTIQIETIQIGTSNIRHLIIFTPLDNPTVFTAIGGEISAGYAYVGPVVINTTGRYLIVTTDGVPDRADPPFGEFAMLVTLLPTGSGGEQILQIDPVFGQVQVRFRDPVATPATCPDLTYTCQQLTCAQAQACYNAGNFSLDEDGDGIPCEIFCGTGAP